ncbi:hypothetical protein EW145_g3909 [Phellinidium pouzarii]|uniref:Uncharacterized protein n=1 Tax=Phellinidium pouzarii TaxID=167371 RepID=A0A4S4L5M8_9AGAM|nr:hypothetical protein EW145_g3909 [Phellinidium pouzarii]
MDVDAKFHQNYIATLHNFSPSLAALHTVRARRSSPALCLSPLHCARCGCRAVTTRTMSDAKPDSRSSRRERTKHKRRHGLLLVTRGQRVRRVCTACSFVSEERCIAADFDEANLPSILASVDQTLKAPSGLKMNPTAGAGNGESSLNSKVRNAVDVGVQDSTSVKAFPRPQRKSDVSTPARLAGSSKRSKKKVGLQEMLARSKEASKRSGEGSGNALAAFLSGL